MPFTNSKAINVRTGHGPRRPWLRPALDVTVIFSLFMLVTCMLISVPTSANPGPAGFSALDHQALTISIPALAKDGPAPIVEIATTSSATAPDAVFRKTSAQAAWLLLAMAFSVAAAFNLAVFRHLRRAYADPRQRGVKGKN